MSNTGYTLADKLRRSRRTIILTATEQALFYELVAICNEVDWADPFQASNDELYRALNISENTLVSSRNKLIQAHLIAYNSGKSKRQFGLYSFKIAKNIKKTTSKSTVDTATNAEVDAEGDTATNAATNAADYIIGQTKTETETETKSIASNEACPEPAEDLKPDSKKGKEKGSAQKEKPVYTQCMAAYDAFIKKRGLTPKIDKVQGHALKEIIPYLEKQVKLKTPAIADDDLPDKTIEAWKAVLDNWHLLDNFNQGKTRLTEINSQLQNILVRITDAHRNNKSNPANQPAKVGNRGATSADLQALKSRRGPDSQERVEFTPIEVVK